MIGTAAGLAALALTAVVGWGTRLIWPDDFDYRFLGGEPWWVAVVAGAGALVGLLRRWLRVPRQPKGALEQIKLARVDHRTALQTVAVSAVSLIGGASLGPFDAGVRSGGAVAEWISARRRLPEDMRAINALTGMNGGIGALLTAPFIATLMTVEVAEPPIKRYYEFLIPNLVGAVFGFFVFFTTAGATFLELFRVPRYQPEVWHFGVAIALGFLAAAISGLLALTTRLLGSVAARFERHFVLLPAIGGAAVGLIAAIFPLTIASGRDQLADGVRQASALGAALLGGVVLAKILAMALSLATGFIGGPVMPTLFIGGIAGLATHLLIPELPVGLTFPALLVGVPGATIGAPFAMILLAAFTVGVGPVATAPVGVAVITAYLLTVGVGLFDPARTTRLRGLGKARSDDGGAPG